jgi:3-dehydroquinate dehydratase/shikimate dehydrogenase
LPNLNSTLRSRIGKVCVAITGTSTAEMLEKATAAAKENPFLEFRLDYLNAPAEALPQLKQFLFLHTEVTAIATCRRAANEGKFTGSVKAELEILLAATQHGEGETAFHIVDVELESAEAVKKEGLDALRASAAGLIISYHDFEATRDLDAIYDRIHVFAPELVKIVSTARCLTDNVTMMRFIERISDSDAIVGICMGDAGIISRVLGLRAGSVFTFAAASAGEETAPGQIAGRTLIETYRVEEVDAATRVYGVAGDPVNKSLSPIMLNTAFRRETVNAVYLALHATDVKDLVTLIQQIPIQGVSITMPHKQSILPYLEHMDPLSKKIGACNTVLRSKEDGKLYGFNTDVAGIITPLEKRLSLKGAKVLVLGCGGSGRAAAFGLRDKGADVFLLNRTPESAAKLAKQSGAKVIKREALAKSTFDVIINSTPIGMAGNDSAQILTAADFQAGLKTKYIFDLVYNPVDTPLIRLARQLGIGIITGVEMFIQQGARQFEIWTGKPAPEEEMLRVVIHALRQQTEPGSAPMTEPPTFAKPVEEIDNDPDNIGIEEPEPEPVKVEPKRKPVKAPAKAATKPAELPVAAKVAIKAAPVKAAAKTKKK